MPTKTDTTAAEHRCQCPLCASCIPHLLSGHWIRCEENQAKGSQRLEFKLRYCHYCKEELKKTEAKMGPEGRWPQPIDEKTLRRFIALEESKKANNMPCPPFPKQRLAEIEKLKAKMATEVEQAVSSARSTAASQE